MKPDMENLSGILKSIKQQVTPWNLKIKYARQLMDSRCQFPSKNNLILEWACQELVFNSKNNCYPDQMLTELWQIITEILQVIKAGKSINTVLLRPPFIEVLLQEFHQTQCPIIPLVQCCKILFSTPEYYRTTSMKYEKFVQFLKNALKFVPILCEMPRNSISTNPEAMDMHLTIYLELIDILLRLYLKLQKQQANLQKAAVGFNEKLLREIAVWKKASLQFSQINANPSKMIDSKDILQQTLWNSEIISGIRGHVHLFGKDETSKENASRNFPMLDSLFTTIEECVADGKSELTRSAMLEFVPELFHTFLSASSESKSLPKHFEFTMFRKFCSAILKSGFASETEVVDRINCIRQLLNAVLDFRVFLVIDETVNTNRNRQFLHSLTELILQNIDSGSNEVKLAVLNCVGHFIEIDLNLLEHQLESICKIMLTVNKTLEDEPSIDDAKRNLLGLILDKYSKIRRTEDFVKMLIASIYACEGNIHLDLLFLSKLENASMTLPVGQSLSIIKILIEELTNHYISRKTDLSPKICDQIIVKLTVISGLLSVFLNNIHILPSNGYIGENQDHLLSMCKTLRGDVVLPLIDVYQRRTSSGKKAKLFGTIWRFMNTLQRVSLFFIDHGFISSPMLHLFNSDGEPLLPENPKSSFLANFLSAEDWTYYVEGIMLYARQLIISSNTEHCVHCFTHVEDLIAYFGNTDEESWSSERQCKLGKVFLKELPWLGSFISKTCLSILSNVFLDSITNHITIDVNKPMENLRGLYKRPDQDKTLSEHKDSIEEYTSFLSAPYFYDNKIFQISFCDCMVQKICKIDVKGDISVPFEMFLERANIEDKGIEPMETDEVLIAGEDFCSVNGDPDTKRALQENCGRSLFVACSDVMKCILGFSDDYMEIHEDKNLCSGVSSFALVSECCKMLKIMNMMNFEWLAPSAAAKLLLLKLLIRRKSSLYENGFGSLEIHRVVFCLLEKFTGSTISANRMAVWKVIDPVLLLQCILVMINDYSEKKSEARVPHDAFQCARNLWLLVLSVKRDKSNDEVFNELKHKMLQLAEEISSNLSLKSVKILSTLLSATLQVIQARVVKKQCLVAASQLTFPVIKKMLTANMDVVFNRYQTEFLKTINEASDEEFNEDQRSFYNTIRCYGHAFSICLQMKSYGKDQNFMSMLNDTRLEDLISETAIVVQKALIQMKSNVSEKESFILMEEVCLDFLAILYVHKDCAETLQLRRKDFCEPVFNCLISILEQKRQKQMESKSFVTYYGIISSFVKTTSSDVGCDVMQHVYKRLVSVMHDAKLLEVSLELLDCLFSTKYSKEKRRSLVDILPKFLYVIIDIVTESVEGDVLSRAYKSLVSLLLLSKDMLAPAYASAALNCILNPVKSCLNSNSCLEVLQIKVTMLRVLLFNHTNAMIGAISSFRSSLNSLLQEFAVLNESNEVEENAIMKACDGILRLYQEIVNHKDVISEFARYFIADYLHMVASNTVHMSYQKHLSSGIYCLLDICPTQDLAYLNIVLPHGERELFKDLHATFTKHHKFQGKA